MTCKGTRHGDYNAAQNHGCTCPTAIAARRRYQRQAMARRRRAGQPLIVDPTGTTRRLQALARIGWGLPYVAQRAGITPGCVKNIAYAERSYVRRDNADAIAAVYDDLCTGDGPSARQRTLATNRGWLGPEAWTDTTIDDPDAAPIESASVRDARDIDLAVVDLACAGWRGDNRLTTAECLESIRRLHKQGLHDRQIARLIGRSHDVVRLMRTDLDLAAIPAEARRSDDEVAA